MEEPEEGYWKHYRHMYVAIVGKDDYLLGNWNRNQKTWGSFSSERMASMGIVFLYLGLLWRNLSAV